jgi:hypothetical protein
MRLMAGDIEVSKTERKIDRVDVLERRREIHEMEDEVERRDPRTERGTADSDDTEGKHLRSGCPSDNPADRW